MRTCVYAIVYQGITFCPPHPHPCFRIAGKSSGAARLYHVLLARRARRQMRKESLLHWYAAIYAAKVSKSYCLRSLVLHARCSSFLLFTAFYQLSLACDIISRLGEGLAAVRDWSSSTPAGEVGGRLRNHLCIQPACCITYCVGSCQIMTLRWIQGR